MKIILIVGARPQFIKLAPLQRAFNRYPQVTIKTIHTGQHYDPNMSGIFFEEMNIPSPDYNCNINRIEGQLAITKMTEAISEILKVELPQWVIVFGDTNSTLAGAIAARNLNINIAHVEAGLRSYNSNLPEEFNRIEVDKLSDILFAPTQTAFDNLISENKNLRTSNIHMVGDIMLESFNHFTLMSRNTKKISVGNLPEEYVLATLHRQHILFNREALANVILSLNEINETIPVIFVAHPRTFNAISSLGVMSTFRIIPAQGYLSMIDLLKGCKIVITDSGGLQKEAFFAKKGSLCIRTETEWTELEKAGLTIVTGYDQENILENFMKITTSDLNFDTPFYGTGNTSNLIIEAMLSF